MWNIVNDRILNIVYLYCITKYLPVLSIYINLLSFQTKYKKTTIKILTLHAFTNILNTEYF